MLTYVFRLYKCFSILNLWNNTPTISLKVQKLTNKTFNRTYIPFFLIFLISILNVIGKNVPNILPRFEFRHARRKILNFHCGCTILKYLSKDILRNSFNSDICMYEVWLDKISSLIFQFVSCFKQFSATGHYVKIGWREYYILRFIKRNSP